MELYLVDTCSASFDLVWTEYNGFDPSGFCYDFPFLPLMVGVFFVLFLVFYSNLQGTPRFGLV